MRQSAGIFFCDFPFEIIEIKKSRESKLKSFNFPCLNKREIPSLIKRGEINQVKLK
jgi:hypothetical protein